MKIWEQGTPEPEDWGQSFATEAFDTELAANQGTFFRMQWASTPAMYIDNLTITQQQGKGADFMLDVLSGAWYYEAVDYAIKNNIMSGYNSISFGPNDTLSHAMVVQVLYNKKGQPAITGTHKFPDVKSGDWFNNAVTWGSQKGVVGGYGDGRFGPNDAVTIEQVAVILWNYSGNPAFTGTPDGVGKYDDWAKNGLSWAVENGIMKDVPMENATDNATRAQTAQMLMNYLSK